jgi:hypothetical protein
MFGKLSVALLLIAASPAIAQDDPPPADTGNAEAQESQPVAYKTKKICRSIEVVGSSIPRRSCTTKRIPIEKPEAEGDTAQSAEGEGPKTE